MGVKGFTRSVPENMEKKKDGHLLDSEEFILRKRLPKKFPNRKNDVYVSIKTNFGAQMARCLRMLDEGCQEEIYIHGLGAAVSRALTLSLRLKDHFSGSVGIAVNTSTTELMDDRELKDDNVEVETQTRNNSAIHIRLFKLSSPS